MENDTDTFEDLLESLREHSIYSDTEDWVEPNNVWMRSLRPQAFKYTEFEKIHSGNIINYSALTINSTLTALYEQDFLYLPEKSIDIVKDLKAVYNPEIRAKKAKLLPLLEDKALSFLDDMIHVDGNWSKESFVEYINEKIKDSTTGIPKSFDIINNSDCKELLAQMLLIQHAVDFLPESSHMARFTKGDYGETQSALFRVMVDEYGYGKHEVKHSTLFKETLRSVGLKTNSHAYWMFYLNSSLLNNNYFHAITTAPERFFEYIGAITYAENTFGPYCKETAKLLKACFGKSVDTRYYKEHAHIDGYHGTMTLNEIIIPLIDQFGTKIIPELVKGIETSGALQKIMEDDFYAQVKWMNNRPKFVQLAKDIKETVLADIDNIPVALLDEPQGELSVAHVHDGDEFCIVDSGLLRFCHGYDCFTDLGPGDCVVILKNRMHGALVLSDSCQYRILSIGDYTKYADYQV